MVETPNRWEIPTLFMAFLNGLTCERESRILFSKI